MAKDSLRGVMIGAGYFGGIQAEAWRRIEEAEIIAVADVCQDRAADFASRWQIPRSYTDVAEMLAAEKPDFVDIATRPDAHLELTRMAADYGAHVICQKPMAPTRDACVEMVDACRNAKVRLLIHENWRWQPWYREVKKLLDSGLLGRLFHLAFCQRVGDGRGAEPYTVQSYFRDMPRLLIYETVVHFLDTFRFLAGEIEAVFCQTSRINPVIQGEDYALIQLRFVSGAHGLIDANRIHGPVPATRTLGTLQAEGDRAAVRLNHDGELFITRYGHDEQPHPFAWHDQGYRGDSVRATQLHCVQSLLNDTRCESEGEDYLRTIDLVDACYRSAETEQPVFLKA